MDIIIWKCKLLFNFNIASSLLNKGHWSKESNMNEEMLIVLYLSYLTDKA